MNPNQTHRRKPPQDGRPNLVLSRHTGETIVITLAEDATLEQIREAFRLPIEIMVTQTKTYKVRLAIRASRVLKVRRGELQERIEQEGAKTL